MAVALEVAMGALGAAVVGLVEKVLILLMSFTIYFTNKDMVEMLVDLEW